MEQQEIFPGNRIVRERTVINTNDGRHTLFIAAFIENGRNATKAAIAAGYSPRSARQIGSQLLTKHDIARQIEVEGEKLLEKLSYSAEITLSFLGKVMAFDPRDLVEKVDGVWKYKRLADLDTWQVAALADHDVDEDGRLKNPRAYSKNEAAKTLAGVHGMGKQVPNKIVFTLQDIVADLDENE